MNKMPQNDKCTPFDLLLSNAEFLTVFPNIGDKDTNLKYEMKTILKF